MNGRLLVGEAAARLGITPSGARWLVDTGRIRSLRTPTGVRLLSARDVERLADERERTSQQAREGGR